MSNDPMPAELKRCIKSWKRKLPDYKIKKWDTHNFDIYSIPFVAEACKMRKWAFACDYIRVYALYTEGGIYLDSDVFVRNSLDFCLANRAFSAVECYPDLVEKIYAEGQVDAEGNKRKDIQYIDGIQIQAAILDAEKGHPFMRDCMNYYHDKHFILQDGSLNNKIISPFIFANIAIDYGFKFKDEEQDLKSGLKIYSSSLFASNMELITEKAVAIHCCAGSWRWMPSSSMAYAVQYMKELRNKYGIAYDAVMSMAVHLDNRNGIFSLVEEDISTLEKRWKKVDKDEFLSYLSSFYRDTKFNEFFLAHKDLYERGIKSYQDNVISHFDIDWYADFYGNEPQETFSVIIGFCNGGGNYGADRQIKGHKKEVFAIVGYYVNKEDMPMYSKEYLPTLIHEFNHSFINHFLDENKYLDYVKELEPAATDLFNSSRWSMAKQAYGNWKTVINESLVRAAVICYMLDKDYKPEEIKNELLEQVQRNFRWTPELVSLLRKYEKKQTKYGSFENFYPRVIDFFEDYAKKENKRLDVIKSK